MKQTSNTLGLIAFCILSILLLVQAGTAQTIYENYTVTTLAGPDEAGPSWQDGLTNVARFGSPFGVAKDAAGNIYVADTLNDTIRKMTPAGVVSTVAGFTATPGSADGKGVVARFNAPRGIAVDSDGNLYVADTGNHTIRKITPDGTVTTLAGLAGASGTANGTGSAARFLSPYGVMVSGGNLVYVADTFNNTIRLITPAGVVSTFAGKAGVAGSQDKTGTAATFFRPTFLAMDSSGNIYVTDTSNELIRKITPAAVVTTLAGSAGVPGSSDGTNSGARFNVPFGITIDSADNIYVADNINNTIRKVTLSGVVTTPLGKAGFSGNMDGPGVEARLNSPAGVVAIGGDIIIADANNSTIRKAIGGTNVVTIAGATGGTGAQNGNGSAARFNAPAGTAVDAAGNVYVADEQNHSIRKITPAGEVTTFAGALGVSGSQNGTGTNAMFNRPLGVAFDPGGNLFVADSYNNAIRKITPDGVVTTFAGLAGVSGTNNGVGTNALFNTPFCLAFDTQTNLYVSDTFNYLIRKITVDGVVSTLAGSGVNGTNNGTGLEASFATPEGIAVDPDGNVFVADDGDSSIRKITPDGVVTTFVGVPKSIGSSDGTNTARFNFPFGLAIDSNRNLYLNDTANHIIRKITPAGAVTTLAGVAGVSGNVDGTGSDARFGRPAGIAVDANGTLYISDEDSHVIRKAYPAPPDEPMVDLITARVGVTRHFSIANQTTTSWSWTLIRNPAASTAQFSSPNSANPTLTPDVEDDYLVRFQGWDDAGRTTIRTLTIHSQNTATITVLINGGGTVTPNLNGQLLQLGQTYSMTAQPSAGCSFINWTGSVTNANATLTFVMETNLTFIANFTDSTRPTIVITSPSGKKFNASNAVFTATGTASDNGQLAAVWYQLNGGSWIQATNTTNWTAGLNLSQSENTLRAYAVDTFDNVSITNSVAFKYIPSSQITVFGTGQGTVTPAYNGWLLQNGKTYSMTAKPAFNYLFVNWTDGAGNMLTTSTKLSFTVHSNMTVQVNFLANPFVAMIGPFAGLFYDTNNISGTNSGSINLTLTTLGHFSAKGEFSSGAKLSFSGAFAPDGTYSNIITSKGSSPLTVQLKLNPVNAGQISGSIGSAGWTSPLVAVRAIFSSVNPAPEHTNKYTLVIPGGEDSTTQPAGNGYGTVSVDISGNVTFSGVLGDGSKAAQKTFINKLGVWPLFVAPYKKSGGAIFGWMTFTNLANSDLNGSLYWLAAPNASPGYPAGFNFAGGIDAVGSVYSFTNGVPLLNLPTGGVSVLQLGNPVQSSTNHFTLGTDNKVTSSDGLTMTITTSSGLFKGTASSPVNGATVPINGILLQKQNTAYGNFLNNGQSGAVSLGQGQ